MTGAGTGPTSSVPGSGSSSCVITTSRYRAAPACSRCGPTVCGRSSSARRPASTGGSPSRRSGSRSTVPPMPSPRATGPRSACACRWASTSSGRSARMRRSGRCEARSCSPAIASRSTGAGCCGSRQRTPRRGPASGPARGATTTAAGCDRHPSNRCPGSRDCPSPSALSSPTGARLRWSWSPRHRCRCCRAPVRSGPVLVRTLTRVHLESSPGTPTASAIGWADVMRPGVRV